MRRRLDTALRVAELRETAARAALAGAQQGLAGAEQARDVLVRAVAEPVSGTFLAARQRQELRARSAVAAEQQAREAQRERDTCLAQYADQRLRVRLLGRLDERLRTEHAAGQERVAQRLADDLGARRPAGMTP